MDFRERFSRTGMGTTMVSASRVGDGQGFESRSVSPIQMEQKDTKQESTTNGFEILEKLRNGEVIEYQGLKFDTPKLRAAQESGKLPNFDFVIQDNEAGISFQSEKYPDRRLLVLMPPDQLENLINVAIARDNGEKKKEERPENPHEWQFRSRKLQFLVETSEGRRPMTPEEMGEMYKKAVDTVFGMHDLGIINMGDMIDKYAEKVGGLKGAALKALYHSTPLFAFKSTVEGYSKSAVDGMKRMPEREAKKRAKFEKKKAAAIAQYDMKERVKEEERVASLIPIKGTSFQPSIEETPNEKSLSFAEGNNRVSIMYSKETKQIVLGQISLFDSQGNWKGNREIQPEEWSDISKVLNQKLTAEQRDQLGSDFLKSVANKSAKPNLNLQLAYQRRSR